MKRLFFLLMAAGALTACNHGANNQQKSSDSAMVKANPALAPVLKFDTVAHDFGKVKEGEKVTFNFNFTNTGKSPLIISDAIASCGCTKPEWPKNPIKPGDKGAVKVVFNSEGHPGLADKMVTVTANTIPAQNMVHLTGEVTPLSKK